MEIINQSKHPLPFPEGSLVRHLVEAGVTPRVQVSKEPTENDHSPDDRKQGYQEQKPVYDDGTLEEELPRLKAECIDRAKNDEKETSQRIEESFVLLIPLSKVSELFHRSPVSCH